MPNPTPKEQYEERKARRNKLRELDAELARKEEQVDVIDTIDRIATSLERLAHTAEELLILQQSEHSP